MMRKFFATILTAFMLTVAVPMVATTASAQGNKFAKAAKKDAKATRKAVKNYNCDQARYNERDGNYGYNDGYGYDEPNVYDRHRKAINIGGGAVAGAILGAVLGGKKGALIGAAVGAGGGYVATKVQKPRNTPYRY
ncbi:MAG TPA: hypothetical protein VNA17_08780 [Pyrinomonadaceae bacterium]|nr:hypothetical protein [Pyrinomonadaceae bacterium]